MRGTMSALELLERVRAELPGDYPVLSAGGVADGSDAAARMAAGADAVVGGSAPLLSNVPMQLQMRLAATQTPRRPLFGPAAATAAGPSNLLEAGPLYAGACVARIADIRPAGELVRELAAHIERLPVRGAAPVK